MLYTVRRIHPGSAFRTVFFLVLTGGGFFGLLFLAVSPFINRFPLALLVFFVFIPLLALLAGAAVYLKAVFYSVLAKKTGGFMLDLEEQKEER